MSSDRDYNFNPSARELQEDYDRQKEAEKSQKDDVIVCEPGGRGEWKWCYNKTAQERVIEARKATEKAAADKVAAEKAAAEKAADERAEKAAAQDKAGAWDLFCCTEIEYDNPYLNDNGLESIVKIYQDAGRNAIEQVLGVSIEDNLV